MSTNPNAPGFEARCQVRPGDSVSVSRVQLVGHPLLAVVSIRYASLPVAAQVAITPGDARRLAAELLNQADEIEGYVPLVFQPDCHRPHVGEAPLPPEAADR